MDCPRPGSLSEGQNPRFVFLLSYCVKPQWVLIVTDVPRTSWRMIYRSGVVSVAGMCSKIVNVSAGILERLHPASNAARSIKENFCTSGLTLLGHSQWRNAPFSSVG